jgi:3-ketosteroid 9alpha-monooxygenase subunit B
VEKDVRREHGYHAMPVKRVVQETADTRSYVLDVPDDLRDTFRYRSGQFCTFRVHLGGEEHLRSYSMSSAPETDADLTVTVKRVPGGLISNWFNDEVAEGDVLELTKPAGVFCVQDETRPVVAFCGGSGVTPVISIVKTVLTTTERPVRVLYANRDRDSVIFERDFEQLQAGASGRLEVRHHLDADGGFLEAGDIRAFAGSELDADFYICGPGPFMDLVESTLLDLPVEPERIFIERFVVEGDHAGTQDPGEVDTPTDVPESVTLILKGQTTTVAYQPGDTVLETARRGGLQPPFSCEAGNCATCMALLREGGARMRANNALTDEEVEEGWILTCQSIPEGPTVTVEYEAF